MTKEQEKGTLAALLEEKRGYENRKRVGAEKADADDPVVAAAGKALVDDMTERIGTIDRQLKALSGKAEKPSSRAQKRPYTRGEQSTR